MGGVAGDGLRSFRQNSTHGSVKSDLQAIENPRDSEGGHDQPVELRGQDWNNHAE